MKNRRQFLQSSAALAAGAALLPANLTRALAAGTAAKAPLLNEFAYGDVQLLDGPMLEQFRRNVALFMDIPDDNLLKPFRQLGGMAAPGEDMGGWYSPSKDFDPPHNMTGYIPGHSFGQYLSGLARAYAVTGDQAIQQKVNRLVAAFGATVTTKFYDGYCIPAYTFDKTNCGLIDAHAFAGDPAALAVLNHATDAVLPWLPEKALDRQEMMARPHPNIAYTWDETYTLPENFYLAYQRGAGVRFRKLAERFLQDDTYFNPLANNVNVLPGQHAYSHVNALCSAMQAYLTEGSQKHLAAARNGFAFVLQQSFATGGWGPNESFCKPGTDTLAKSLDTSHSSFETLCGAYGHFKIARYLMRVTGDSTYGDSMEAVLYNTILGARPLRPDGVSFYYSDYNMQAHKQDYEQKWPCCSGTFPQITADYGISSYLRSEQGVYVNLYVPSKVTWSQAGARVTLTQQTSYPTLGETTLHLSMDRPRSFFIALRVPTWAASGSTVRVNGKPVDAVAQPGTWLRLHRAWKHGDRVELSLDMPLRLLPLDEQHPGLVALLHGPVALFAIEPGTDKMTKEQLLRAARTSASSDAWEVAAGRDKVTMKPFPAIDSERYRLYQEI